MVITLASISCPRAFRGRFVLRHSQFGSAPVGAVSLRWFVCVCRRRLVNWSLSSLVLMWRSIVSLGGPFQSLLQLRVSFLGCC